jgi:hypothetical protein
MDISFFFVGDDVGIKKQGFYKIKFELAYVPD